jgi:hypothetical protein
MAQVCSPYIQYAHRGSVLKVVDRGQHLATITRPTSSTALPQCLSQTTTSARFGIKVCQYVLSSSSHCPCGLLAHWPALHTLPIPSHFHQRVSCAYDPAASAYSMVRSLPIHCHHSHSRCPRLRIYGRCRWCGGHFSCLRRRLNVLPAHDVFVHFR